MEIKKAEFLKSATDPSHYPNYPYPEFAFLGRSNVGKSSLINMILGNRSIVKTSSKPGHTQTINFFIINDAISIADLPGFGFAKAPGQIRKNFIPMITRYLEERTNLKIAFLLIDARRKVEDEEREFIHILSENRISTAIVITKIDKLTNNELSAKKKEFAESLGISPEDLFLTSSSKKSGYEEIHELIKENSERPSMGQDS